MPPTVWFLIWVKQRPKLHATARLVGSYSFCKDFFAQPPNSLHMALPKCLPDRRASQLPFQHEHGVKQRKDPSKLAQNAGIPCRRKRESRPCGTSASPAIKILSSTGEGSPEPLSPQQRYNNNTNNNNSNKNINTTNNNNKSSVG